jgi:hypothetical protein
VPPVGLGGASGGGIGQRSVAKSASAGVGSDPRPSRPATNKRPPRPASCGPSERSREPASAAVESGAVDCGHPVGAAAPLAPSTRFEIPTPAVFTVAPRGDLGRRRACTIELPPRSHSTEHPLRMSVAGIAEDFHLPSVGRDCGPIVVALVAAAGLTGTAIISHWGQRLHYPKNPRFQPIFARVTVFRPAVRRTSSGRFPPSAPPRPT